MATIDPHVRAHLEWLGYVQPVGLVVSAPALVRAGAVLDGTDRDGQRLLRDNVADRRASAREESEPLLLDFHQFATNVLGWRWSAAGYAGTPDTPIPEELHVHLPDYEETLVPDFAVRDRHSAQGATAWQLLVHELQPGTDLDRPVGGEGTLEASPHARMERLLRRTGVPAGLLCNARTLRLISAPHGESSGWLDFRLAEMVQTAGRPICSALRLLLSEQRLLAMGRDQRLAALLQDSRKFQNEVSERLAGQVLHALYELLRGFQSADDAVRGELLGDVVHRSPDDVYHGMLHVILRMVFLLYAEERGMLPDDEVFLRHYSLAGLFERLRGDAAVHPDTMGQRYGAWGQFLTLSRLVFDGAEIGELRLPRRHGVLFDPQRYPFLEGRDGTGARQIHERVEPPRVPDGTVHHALEKLLILDGERISYRALDVEQIGSVYETMMGFRVQRATGTSIAIRAVKSGGAPTTIDLDELLRTPAQDRTKRVREWTDRKLTPTVAKPLKEAATIDELHVALDRVIDKRATPDLVAIGSLVLQPSDARRRSGSHYTPRSLTGPIVATALRPVLARLVVENDGVVPRPAQVLDLKVCDPAMGSGAFLVETCRQLGDALVESWRVHDEHPDIPVEDDDVVYARRLIAQRCLYGVDRNSVAVDLAKVSLWLVTLARDQAFTFVDHAFRHGDSLVGLSNRQIAARDWSSAEPLDSEAYRKLAARVERSMSIRRQIREAKRTATASELRRLLDDAEHELMELRTYGDLVVEAFFQGSGKRARVDLLKDVWRLIGSQSVRDERERLDELREAELPLVPFHWELEFPEVFAREPSGFDTFIGNPPFAGKNAIVSSNTKHYLEWLNMTFTESHGNADLVAYFFRRAFDHLRIDGTSVLIGTNTIAQGDTRSTGLRWICMNGGDIFEARKRIPWPGKAVVVVSSVAIYKGHWGTSRTLNGVEAETISAFLLEHGGSEDPNFLDANSKLSFQGCVLLGKGFTFDDKDKYEEASSIAEMLKLIEARKENSQVIHPFIGSSEVNSSPTHQHHRYAIDFFDRSETDCRNKWPELLDIVETKVKPLRDRQSRKALRERWWQYAEKRPGLREAVSDLESVLACPGGTTATKHLSFVFLPRRTVFSQTLCIFPIDDFSYFSILQSRVHEIWARFFGATFKDDLRYNSDDCFRAFPLPDKNGAAQKFASHRELVAIGADYYAARAKLLKEKNIGLTKLYNEFHDPRIQDEGVNSLREKHDLLDSAVAASYGWNDVSFECGFYPELLDDSSNANCEEATTKQRWRYCWSDTDRDEVLKRLLTLNRERAKNGSDFKGRQKVLFQ